MKPAFIISLGCGGLLMGLVVVAVVWSGGGGAVDCGTWGLTCAAWALVVVPFALLLAAVPLSIGAGKLARPGFASAFWRLFALVVSAACIFAFVSLLVAWSMVTAR
jgi:hypothetical protein